MEKYEFLQRTGEGAYGSVWRARDKNTGLLVAVKKMKDVPTTEEEAEIAMREVRVLQLAKHVNIVNLLEAYKSQSGRLYLVFEYVERTLLQELKANRGGMPGAAVKSLTWQLLQSLSYLHRKQIIHRDVKPSNILITESGVLKICDFGFARACSGSSNDPAYTTYVVTRWYRAPEVLVGDNYGPPVDVWALGCIFAEMLAGRPLFPGKNHHDQLWLILKCLGTMTERQLELLDADPTFACFRLPTQGEIESLEYRLGGISPPAMQFLRACLNPDPKQRATADELLAMPYFNGVSDVIPMEDLQAYPDADMRSRLERAAAQDQASAAAAAARESHLLLPTTSKRTMLTPTGSKTHMNPHCIIHNGNGATSPSRTATGQQQLQPMPQQQQLQQQQLQPMQQQQQQQTLPQQQQHSSLSGLLPSKAASVPKLDSHTHHGTAATVTEARPPLQRFITAPAGSMASKMHTQPPPLQPLSQHGGYAQVAQPQRSRPSSGGGSQQVSPSESTSSKAVAASQQQQHPQAQVPVAPPGPVREERVVGSGGGLLPSGLLGGGGGGGGMAMPRTGRTWRMSGDGEYGGPTLLVRQLSGSVHPQSYANTNGSGSNSNGAALEPTRAGPDHSMPTLRAPQQQRTTWNGTSSIAPPPPVHRNAASNGGNVGSSGGAGNGGGQQQHHQHHQHHQQQYQHQQHTALGSSTLSGGHGSSSSSAPQDMTSTGQRKAHSLAGNEGGPPPAMNGIGSAPVGGRNGGGGGGGGGGGLNGVQGRSFAPMPGSVNGTSVPTLQFGFPTANTIGRLCPSPPPPSYGPLRGTNPASHASLPLERNGNTNGGNGSGRVSNDGSTAGNGNSNGSGSSNSGMYGTPSVTVVALGGGGSSKSLNVHGGGVSHMMGGTTSHTCMLDSEASDSSCYADATAFLNEGRRASDTVLYAAAALKEAKHRLDKASHLIAGSGRAGLLDGVGMSSAGVNNGGAVGSNGDGNRGPSFRAPSFGRATGPFVSVQQNSSSGGGMMVNGPASPDSVVPPNLPPLMGGTPRRISAPEACTTSSALGAPPAIANAHSNGVSNAGGQASNGGGVMGPNSGGVGGGGCGSRVTSAVSHPPSGNGYLQRHNLKQHSQQQGFQGQAHGPVANSNGLAGGLQQQHSQQSGAGSDGDGAADGGLSSERSATHTAFLPALEVNNAAKAARVSSAASAGTAPGVGTARRPSKGSLRSVGPDSSHCKREEATKVLVLEAVPEAGVL